MSIQPIVGIAICHVSIPKGAIMRTEEEKKNADNISFNSKRCDYETQRGFEQSKPHYVSIPKGAIMSNLQSSFLPFFNRFNSKRCDYEFGSLQMSVASIMFQFQKVRL